MVTETKTFNISRPYVIDNQEFKDILGKPFVDWFRDQYDHCIYNGAYINLCWDEFGKYPPEDDDELYNDDMYNYEMEKKLRDVAIASGIPEDAGDVVVHYWW